MGDVIAIHLDNQWKIPVCITTPQRLIKVIRGPEEALAALMRSWPDIARGAKFAVAKRTCIAALCGRETTQNARLSFVNACHEAHVHFRETPLL